MNADENSTANGRELTRIKNKIHHRDTEGTERSQNKIRRLHRFRFRTSAGRQERKETAVLIMSSTRVACESPVVICVICEICGLYFCLRALCVSVVNSHAFA